MYELNHPLEDFRDDDYAHITMRLGYNETTFSVPREGCRRNSYIYMGNLPTLNAKAIPPEKIMLEHSKGYVSEAKKVKDKSKTMRT